MLMKTNQKQLVIQGLSLASWSIKDKRHGEEAFKGCVGNTPTISQRLSGKSCQHGGRNLRNDIFGSHKREDSSSGESMIQFFFFLELVFPAFQRRGFVLLPCLVRKHVFSPPDASRVHRLPRMITGLQPQKQHPGEISGL